MPRVKDDAATHNYKIDIGERLRALREHLGMTQAVFAAQIAVNQEIYHKWEYGKIFPNPVKMLALCLRYNVDFNYLYLGTFRGLPSDLEAALRVQLGAK